MLRPANGLLDRPYQLGMNILWGNIIQYRLRGIHIPVISDQHEVPTQWAKFRVRDSVGTFQCGCQIVALAFIELFIHMHDNLNRLPNLILERVSRLIHCTPPLISSLLISYFLAYSCRMTVHELCFECSKDSDIFQNFSEAQFGNIVLKNAAG
jgi:hypothetical protein